NQTEIRQKQTALFAAEEAQAKWGDKGEYKRTAERLTTLLTGILAKQAAGGIATQLISPEVNQWIKEATTNDKGETDKIANTLAHAIWGAIEATANRGNPTSGAIAAASAELAAPMLAKVLYNKDKAEQLTAEEKAQITALSSMTAAVAGGLTAQGSSQSNTTVSSLTHASIGGEIGKIAVENNYLLPNQVEALRRKLVKTIENGTPLEEVYREFGQLSENQRKELSAGCIDAILCRHTTLDLIDQSNQLARDFTSFIGSFFSQLPDEEQGRFVEFIIDENAKSASLLTEKIGFTEALVAQLVNDYINNIGSLNKKVSPKVSNFARKIQPNKHIEVIAPKVKTWEQARNQALNKVGDLGTDSKPIIGRLGTSDGLGKTIGRQSADGKKGWRLDYDEEKGMHINVFDFSQGKGNKGIKEVIPFEGNQDDFKRYLKQLNK
ncbi:VENN motif pre-toxin domain-containing protein, partial [Pasteurella multocida]|uniref:VENN motif pre-toxin domain-containing protein n=1 Tax=Pasteurella multocida TaxID=747 RepID=UPI00397AA42D